MPVVEGRHGHLPPIEDRKHFDEINDALDAEHDVKFKGKKYTQPNSSRKVTESDSSRK